MNRSFAFILCTISVIRQIDLFVSKIKVNYLEIAYAPERVCELSFVGKLPRIVLFQKTAELRVARASTSWGERLARERQSRTGRIGIFKIVHVYRYTKFRSVFEFYFYQIVIVFSMLKNID